MRTFKFIGMAAMTAFMSMGMISCGDDSLQSITEAPEEVEKPADKDLEFALSAESENLVNNEVSIGAEGKELGISFATNTDWNAKVSFSDENAKEWCSITPINGKAGVNSLRIKIDRNKEVDRSTKITILLESASDQSHISEIKLNVTQSYMDTTKKLHIETAGTLPTLMSGEESKAVKELTLSGFINGIDIKFIRYMKNLVKIDLSDVNIVSGGDDYWFTAVETGVEIEDNIFPMGFFEHLKYLEEIKLPNSIVEIERKAFYKWKNRISIDIPNGVTTIGDDAFIDCINLTSITIPSKVTQFGIYYNENGVAQNKCFYGCTALKEVHIKNPNPPTILEDTFSVYADATLYVPIGSKEAYQNHSIWGKFGTIIEE